MDDASAYRLVHSVRMPMRWGDMDAMGHVNNTVYFRYLEQARIAWFESMGFPPAFSGIGPVIISAHCTFLKQLRYPGDIDVSTLVGEFGRSSFHTRHQIRRVDEPDTLMAEGGSKVVWVDQRIEKSVALPDEMRVLLTKQPA
ncbi:MAG: acyl-CoA thioesterase [Oxalobacteraceae bacterium]|jgi:acyl-CoA thioester hydrolase|nr:acyl-CoA thioesterase [Oxalobacteraceae bacterium]